MDVFRVSFIGHREIENYQAHEHKLIDIITHLLHTKEFVEFMIGRNGEFDIFTASCIKRIQKKIGYGNSAITLVLPYTVADIEFYSKYYDNIIIPEEMHSTHFKFAITKRNQWMIEHSNLLIAYVHREIGGAATCLKMAQKINLKTICV